MWQCEPKYSWVQGGNRLSGRCLHSMEAPCPRQWGQLVYPRASHWAPEHELFVFGPLQHQANPSEMCLWSQCTQETNPFWSLVIGKHQMWLLFLLFPHFLNFYLFSKGCGALLWVSLTTAWYSSDVFLPIDSSHLHKPVWPLPSIL